MTITPTATATPSTGSGTATSASDPSSGGTDFLAAMLQALGGAPATGDAKTGTTGGPAADPKDQEDAPVDAAALGLVVPPVPLPGAAATPAVVTVAGAGQAKVTRATGAVPAGTTSDIGTSGGADRAPTATPGAALTPGQPGGDPAGRSGSPRGSDRRSTGAAAGQDAAAGPLTGPTPDAAPDRPTAVAPDAATQAPVAAAALAPDPASAVGSSAPVAGAATAGQPSAPADVAPAHHVARQVFPEVTSLVTHGDGTHRITLALKPEALGEVRVVMTVRDGSVHVRLAAGQEAQRALLEGSPELSRLLEQAGATDTRVVVRDLGTSTGPTDGSATSHPADLGAGGTGPQDQHAGTRAQHPATDGTHDSTPHHGVSPGANPPRSNEPVTHARTAGVDVTM